MNYTETDLKLFELFANKELTPWCIVYFKWTKKSAYFKFLYMEADEPIKGIYDRAWYIGQDLENKKDCNGANVRKYVWHDCFIKWHEPTITDIFRVAQDKWFTFDLINFWTKQPRLTSLIPSNENFNIPYNPTISFLKQSEATKEQLIKLFS